MSFTSKYINSILSNLGTTMIEGIEESSFYICMLVGLVALILSVCGYDKGKKLSLLSPSIYMIIQIFLKGVFNV